MAEVSLQTPSIFRLAVPLPASPLKEIHPYFIKGDNDSERNLLIDTAFSNDVCENALSAALESICKKPYREILEQTDVFVTHMHVDHCGLIARLKNESNTIFASSGDKNYIDGFQSVKHWDWLNEVNVWAGTPPEYALNPVDHVAFLNRPEKVVPITILNAGEKIFYGGYELEVLAVGGHTPGQIGLWNEQTRTFFCGDHILERISPNISAWNLQEDFLQLFCGNLLKIRNMNVKNLFPAHGPELFDDAVRRRIDEILLHHKNRLNEIENQVQLLSKNQSVTAFMIAQKIEWARGKDFFDLPVQQKWFACSETLAHLQSLTFAHRIQSDGAVSPVGFTA